MAIRIHLDPSPPAARETRANFAARVLARCGVPLAMMAKGEPASLLGGHIMCRRGGRHVVTVGYPTVNDEGEEVYDEFVVVDL